jgi:hypothetical protein
MSGPGPRTSQGGPSGRWHSPARGGHHVAERLALALVLLPCITFAPGCDDRRQEGLASDGIADSEGSGGMESTGDTDRTAASGDTEGPTVGTGVRQQHDGDTSSRRAAAPAVKPDYPDGRALRCGRVERHGLHRRGRPRGHQLLHRRRRRGGPDALLSRPGDPLHPGDSFDQGCMGLRLRLGWHESVLLRLVGARLRYAAGRRLRGRAAAVRAGRRRVVRYHGGQRVRCHRLADAPVARARPRRRRGDLATAASCSAAAR